jgi:hypothetical protein
MLTRIVVEAESALAPTVEEALVNALRETPGVLEVNNASVRAADDGETVLAFELVVEHESCAESERFLELLRARQPRAFIDDAFSQRYLANRLQALTMPGLIDLTISVA